MHTRVFVIVRKQEFFKYDESLDYLIREFFFSSASAEDRFGKFRADFPNFKEYDQFEIVEASLVDTKTLEYDMEMASG